MRKLFGKILTACLALVLCGAVTACGPNDDGLDAGGNVARINMWVGGSEWSGRNLRNLETFINAYNDAKPDGFTVKLSRKDDLEKAFQTARTQGSQPDIMLWDRFNTATNVVSDYLYPVSDLIERDAVDTSVFYAPAMQEMQYGGETYGLPVDVDVWGTYVNMDMVQAYDAKQTDEAEKIGGLLKADWTWNDLLTVAKALKTSTVAGYSSGDQEQHLFKYYVSTGHGAEYLTPIDAAKGKYQTNFDNEWTRDVLRFFKQVKDADVGGKQEDTSFTSKVLAMVNKPLYYNNYILNDGKVTNYKFLPQPKPSADSGVNGGMVGGYGMAFPKPDDKNKTKAWEARHEAAWKFTKWLTTQKANMLAWSKQIGSLPALTEALNDETCVQGNAVLSDARSYVSAVDGQGKPVYITRPQVPNFLTLQTDVINAQVPLYLNGGSLDDCIRNLTSSGNQKLILGL